MKLRVRCGSKCGGSQPRTRRIPPRLAGPTSPARSDGLKRGSQAPPAMPLFSRSRRLRSRPVRGVLFRLCIRGLPFRVDTRTWWTRRRRNASADSGALLLPAALYFSAANTDPTPGSNDKQPRAGASRPRACSCTSTAATRLVQSNDRPITGYLSSTCDRVPEWSLE